MRYAQSLISLQKPSPLSLRRFLETQMSAEFSYDAVGATATASVPPPGFVRDHTRVELGDGEHVFHEAKAALQCWEQFRLGWVDVWPTETPLEAGQVVAVMGHAVGLWWTNACRIVFTVDDSAAITRYGFAYGTLPGHVECGEERFVVEWDRRDDRVWYDILAFSRPHHVAARLGRPLVRRLQRRFGRDSAAAMQNVVAARAN